MAGLREALRLGFTHALQVDADGQHDLQAVPRFIAAAQCAPTQLICGFPEYDASVPKGRLYARYLTPPCLGLGSYFVTVDPRFYVWFSRLSIDARRAVI